MILLFRGASQKLTLVVDDCCNRDPDDPRCSIWGTCSFHVFLRLWCFFNQVARLLIGIGSLLHEMTEPSRVRRGSLRKSVWSPRVPRKMLQVLSVSTFFIVIAIWTNGMGRKRVFEEVKLAKSWNCWVSFGWLVIGNGKISSWILFKEAAFCWCNEFCHKMIQTWYLDSLRWTDKKYQCEGNCVCVCRV